MPVLSPHLCKLFPSYWSVPLLHWLKMSFTNCFSRKEERTGDAERRIKWVQAAASAGRTGWFGSNTGGCNAVSELMAETRGSFYQIASPSPLSPLSTLSQMQIRCRANKQWLVDFFVLAGFGVIRTTVGTSTENLFSSSDCEGGRQLSCWSWSGFIAKSTRWDVGEHPSGGVWWWSVLSVVTYFMSLLTCTF